MSGLILIRCCFPTNEGPTVDWLYVALVVAFFALSIALAYGFECLRRP